MVRMLKGSHLRVCIRIPSIQITKRCSTRKLWKIMQIGQAQQWGMLIILHIKRFNLVITPTRTSTWRRCTIIKQLILTGTTTQFRPTFQIVSYKRSNRHLNITHQSHNKRTFTTLKLKVELKVEIWIQIRPEFQTRMGQMQANNWLQTL